LKVDAEEITRDFHTPKLVQVMFYAMMLSAARELISLPCIRIRTFKDALLDLNCHPSKLGTRFIGGKSSTLRSLLQLLPSNLKRVWGRARN